jgi:hypothetical protein
MNRPVNMGHLVPQRSGLSLPYLGGPSATIGPTHTKQNVGVGRGIELVDRGLNVRLVVRREVGCSDRRLLIHGPHNFNILVTADIATFASVIFGKIVKGGSIIGGRQIKRIFPLRDALHSRSHIR